jgi:acyl-homoserine-lactone acylase
LVKADEAPATHPLKQKLSEQIAMLRNWDFRWGLSSIPTSLAVFYTSQGGGGRGGRRGGGAGGDPAVPASERMLQNLAAASDKLQVDFGPGRCRGARSTDSSA